MGWSVGAWPGGGQDTYLGIYFWNGGDQQLRLYKRINGAFTQLGASFESGPLPAGTVLALSAVGSRIALSENGVERIVVTDSSLSSGAPGLMTFGAATADDWSGGEVGGSTPPARFSVGGTVSGLSGTVVLQDNGGDDLSVSSDGGFTFGSLFGSGGSYDVTVKSSPSGQLCSVSGGSGTVGSANVTSVSVSCVPVSVVGEDGFDRADGGLGAGWAPMSDGGLSISSQAVVGTAGTDGGRSSGW